MNLPAWILPSIHVSWEVCKRFVSLFVSSWKAASQGQVAAAGEWNGDYLYSAQLMVQWEFSLGQVFIILSFSIHKSKVTEEWILSLHPSHLKDNTKANKHSEYPECLCVLSHYHSCGTGLGLLDINIKKTKQNKVYLAN